MKFAFSSNAFLHCTLSETIELLADIGYQGIEIMADVPHAYPLYFTERGYKANKEAPRPKAHRDLECECLYAQRRRRHLPSFLDRNRTRPRGQEELNTRSGASTWLKSWARLTSPQNPVDPWMGFPAKKGSRIFLMA